MVVGDTSSTIRMVPIPDVLPRLVANDGLKALRAAIADPERWRWS